MFRIFPPFYLYLGTIASLVVVGSIRTTWPDVFYAGSFLWNYKGLWSTGTDNHSWYLGHFWSLCLEEQFYLLWPPILLLLGVQRACYAAVAMIMVAPLIRVATYFTYPPARGLIGMMLHTQGDAIMVGCLAAFWQNHAALERVLRRLDHWLWPCLAAVFLFLVSRGLLLLLRGAYGITVGMTLNNCTVAFLLFWITRHPCSTLGKLLNSRLIMHLGVLSYSLYLWQQLFLAPFGTTWMSMFPISVGMCMLAAECSYWFVERPCLRLRDRVLKRDSVALSQYVGFGIRGRAAVLINPVSLPGKEVSGALESI
jgi:peptidoglycan/LPS O-acetylase OafA/YrhL